VDPLTEALAVRRGGGVIELARGTIQVTGSERLGFLDGLLTCDVKVLRPGACAYAALLNARGRVLADLLAYDVGEGYLLDVDASLTAKVLGILGESRVSEDVACLDRTAEFGRWSVLGPQAPRIVEAAFSITAPVRGAWVEAGDAVVARTDALALPGFDILAPPGLVLTDRLAAAGAVTFGEEAWEVLRLEAGRPRYGADMDEGTIALEARLEGAISFDKGCYVGQEVVARVVHRGHLKRYLVPLVLDSPAVPPRMSPVRREGESVGHVTSAARSAALGRGIALAYVRAGLDEPGTALVVETPDGTVSARVATPPLVPLV